MNQTEPKPAARVLREVAIPRTLTELYALVRLLAKQPCADPCGARIMCSACHARALLNIVHNLKGTPS